VLIVVPPHLSPRLDYIGAMLVGSGVEVVLDRRHALRRRNPGGLAGGRRRRDRRASCHVFGYLYGCTIVRVVPPTFP
jgi:hypothetical protein